MSRRLPCPTCPWRVAQHADEIPNFSLDLAEALVDTTSGELGSPMFACHQSQEGREVTCAGWLCRYGWESITVRLNLMHGKLKPEECDPPPHDWPELHDTFDEVIEKLRADER